MVMNINFVSNLVVKQYNWVQHMTKVDRGGDRGYPNNDSKVIQWILWYLSWEGNCEHKDYIYILFDRLTNRWSDRVIGL